MSDLQAGRERDAQVAEQVMGCSVERCERPVFRAFCRCVGEIHWQSDMSAGVPNYSTNIPAAAMGAMEHWQGDFDIRRQNGSWRVTLFEPSMQYEEWADALPLAICRALLKATRD